MFAWHVWFFLLENPHAHKIPPFRGGDFFFGGASPLPESRSENILFRPSWNMQRIFREASCGHFSWRFKDENRQTFLPKFRRFFARVAEKFRLNVALGDCPYSCCAALNSRILGTPQTT